MPAATRSSRAELPAPAVVRNFLSEDEIRKIFAFGREMQIDEDGGALVNYGDSHFALFLHHGGFMFDDCWRSFATAQPELLKKVISKARHHAAEAGICPCGTDLSIRCIELHSYTCGGGLEDRNHTDHGSSITLSVQLSPPGDGAGGCFSTTNRAGVTAVHELSAGDAIVLHSEMVHNVSTLTSGERNSLVIELWTGRANRRDRFS